MAPSLSCLLPPSLPPVLPLSLPAKRYPGRDLRVLKESLCHVTIIFAPPPLPPFQSGI